MPAIQVIKRRFPGHRFVLLTDEHAGRSNYVSSWDVLGPTGWFDEVIFYTPGKAVWDMSKKGFSLIRKVRKLSPEYIFNLSPVRSCWQTARDRFYFKHLIGHVRYNAPRRRVFFYRDEQSCKGADGCEPEWEILLGLAGGHGSGAGFKLIVPGNESARFQRIARAKGFCFLPEDKKQKLLAVGPGSKMPAKRWPAQNFCELGKLLLKKFPQLHLMVLGGREDEETGNELCRAWGERSCNFAGELSIYGSAAALERCAGFVGNDSGTMHLAAMTGAPCVALFSARDRPGKWAPYGDNHIILRHNTECAGCMLEECAAQHGQCLRLITPPRVFEAVRKILAGSTDA